MATKIRLPFSTRQRKQYLSWVFWGLALILITLSGIGLSKKLFPRPKIGVIYIDQTISQDVMTYFSLPISYAMQHDDVAAVVLIIDSPGGTASTSEELFYRVIQLRSKKPVVASINRLGASGAYYAAVAANYIYAKPASVVGSVGVISVLPGTVRPSETLTTTGPFKGGGSTQVDWIRGVEMLKNAFVSHVYEQRLYALAHMHRPSRAPVLPEKDFIGTGRVWFAPEAYDIGLIDALGSDLDAIRKAADLAHVANYEIVDLTGLALLGDPTFYFASDRKPIDEGAPGWLLELQQDDSWPDFYHLYLPLDQ